mmetsp:Transcript_68288/g.94945  ORF Transcript_68288/g.94945 Transcript_68288/m.94945 type:complete len:427 (+) Transcript_68288:438-1718(+)
MLDVITDNVSAMALPVDVDASDQMSEYQTESTEQPEIHGFADDGSSTQTSVSADTTAGLNERAERLAEEVGGYVLVDSPVMGGYSSPIIAPGSPVVFARQAGLGLGYHAVDRVVTQPTRRPGSGRNKGNAGKRVFVGNLPKSCTIEELSACIAAHVAMPTEVRIIRDRETNVSKGYGFLTFVTVADAEKCLAATTITCQKRLLNFGPAKHKRRSDDFSSLPGGFGGPYSPVPERSGGGGPYFDPYGGTYSPGYTVGPEYAVANQQYDTVAYPAPSGQVFWPPAQTYVGPAEGGAQGSTPVQYGYATNVPQMVTYPASVDSFGIQRHGLPSSPATLRRVELIPAQRVSSLSHVGYPGPGGAPIAVGPPRQQHVIATPVVPQPLSQTAVWSSAPSAVTSTVSSEIETPDLSKLQISGSETEVVAPQTK